MGIYLIFQCLKLVKILLFLQFLLLQVIIEYLQIFVKEFIL